jgi:methylated-DNA-[protein]-cysteine S-methyltransferase
MKKNNFNQRVWQLLKQIPEGKVTTYKIIAEKLGIKAYRAIGNACAKNPYSVLQLIEGKKREITTSSIIPCHRVVNSLGHLHGFGGSKSNCLLNKKRMLLEREGVEIKNNKVDLKKYLFNF